MVHLFGIRAPPPRLLNQPFTLLLYLGLGLAPGNTLSVCCYVCGSLTFPQNLKERKILLPLRSVILVLDFLIFEIGDCLLLSVWLSLTYAFWCSLNLFGPHRIYSNLDFEFCILPILYVYQMVLICCIWCCLFCILFWIL